MISLPTFRDFQELNEASPAELVSGSNRAGRRFVPLRAEYLGLSFRKKELRFAVGKYRLTVAVPALKVVSRLKGSDLDKLSAALGDDVRVHCTCPDFRYGGFQYVGTQLDYSLRTEDRFPSVRNPKEEGTVCKHLTYLLGQLDHYTDDVAADIARSRGTRWYSDVRHANESELPTFNDFVDESGPSPDGWYHGSPSGDLRGGPNGLHVGSKLAATQALESRIGVPADGWWDGKRTYGSTLLAGQRTLARLSKERGYGLVTGYNCGAPQEDYLPKSRKDRAKYGDGTAVEYDARPRVVKVSIVGPMSNSSYSPMEDARANGIMAGMRRRGMARKGYFYTNAGEDEGSVSAVLPDGRHVLVEEV